jgi:poly(3-hydroxybutyrate) depolymerase
MNWKRILWFKAIVVSLALGLMMIPMAGKAHAQCVELVGVQPVPGIEVQNAFRFGTTVNYAISLLPPVATLNLSGGSTATATLAWTIPYKGREWTEITSAITFNAIGTFQLPAGVCQPTPSIPLQVNAAVKMLAAPRFTFDWEGLDQPGTYGSAEIQVGGVLKTYHYYIPSYYDGSKSFPLFVDLHGGGSYGIGEMSNSRSDRVAEKEGFIVVAPDNYTTAFVSALIDKMAIDFNIDKRRVYVIGISAGGTMSATLAYEIPEKIAAFGIVSSGANFYTTYFAKNLPRPMTFVNFHGLTDPLNLAFGVDPFTINEYMLEQTLCSPSTEQKAYWPPKADDPTEATRYAYSGGIYGTEVVLYAHTGGHVWPGGRQYAAFATIGLCTYQFSATEEFWNIVKNHAIPEEVAIDIKLGSMDNSINPASKGVIPVAILTSDSFDAVKVDVQTVSFGPGLARPQHYSLEDVNKDGKLDIVLHFRTEDTGIQSGETSAMLTGRSFFGTDSIKTTSPKGKK